MDDFFKNREDVPHLKDGTSDYESLGALDMELLFNCLSKLVQDGSATLPVFDFKTGRRSDRTRECKLGPGRVAVVEGLHALDTAITENLPQESCLKIYVSVSSDFVDDNGSVVLPARDVRLMRRTVRDANFRASPPEHTLSMWNAVCNGEDVYVRPFKKYADIAVNSTFGCEPCLFRSTVEKLYGAIGRHDAFYPHARCILDAVSRFTPMPQAIMPAACVLREFFGKSVYYNRSGGKT